MKKLEVVLNVLMFKTKKMEIEAKIINAVPYQLCPKCNGQGIVSKPPYVAGDVNEYMTTQTSFQCDVCNGAKIILMHVDENT